MIAIDKIRLYIRSVAKTEEEYNNRLLSIWVSPDYRNKECKHPECETCDTCPLNKLWRK